MASLQNKISESNPSTTKSPTFERSLVYSLLFHLSVMFAILGFTRFNVSIWKKPPPIASVVWTQTVKRPKPTIKDKLPPPLVSPQKTEEPKKEEVNIKKTPEPEKKKVPEETAQEKMKKALEALKKKVSDDDRPAPREDNFPTEDKKQPEGVMSNSEILSLEANPAYSQYIQSVKEIVKNNFIWYKEDKFVTSISLKIDSQGNILSSKIEKSSGNFAYDQAVLRAIQQSNPLPSPPNAEFAKMFVQEGFEFNFERKTQ